MVMQPDRQKHSLPTRLLHLALLVVVLHQLATSLLIGEAARLDQPSLPLVEHEWVGIGGLAILGVYWLWTLVRSRETTFASLLPWLTVSCRQAAWHDLTDHLRAVTRGHLPRSNSMALAHAVHGAGLLVASAMALSGAATWFLASGNPVHEIVLDTHLALGNLMWVYLVGHAGMAALHQLMGYPVLQEMLDVRAGRSGPQIGERP
jgi:cytochrome b561